MADSLADAAGKGVSFEVGGKKYEVSPLTIGDLADFEAFIRTQRIKEFREASDGLSSEERIKVLTELAKCPVDQEALSEATTTITGIQYLLWKSLKKKQPEITLEKMSEVVKLDNYEEMSQLLQAIGGGDDKENPPTED